MIIKNKKLINIIYKNLESNFLLISRLKNQSKKIREQYFKNLAKTITNQIEDETK